MLNVCIYCGHNKSLALEECAICNRTPSSHSDVIHSIIAIREKIQSGEPVKIKSDIFQRAEEAYSAVELNSGPKAIQYLSNISLPIISIIALVIFSLIFI